MKSFPLILTATKITATVGSCLGLWLGLGVIHIMDSLVTAISTGGSEVFVVFKMYVMYALILQVILSFLL